MTLNETLEAIAAHLTNQGVKTFAWEEPNLQTSPPLATLFLDSVTPGNSDQGIRSDWSKIDIALRYYVSWRQTPRGAQKQMQDGLDTMLAAFAGDPQISGSVVSLQLPPGNSVPILVDHEDSLLIAQWKLEVTPW